jgi:nitroimidazol reductase NimA-like FMN-containing flavoprotein (pyridoxamine 5'-phosphate oxidase superfamily)
MGMPEREPTETKNLDIYGHDPLEWTRARDEIVALAPTPRLAWFLGTVRPDGRPHAAGFGGAWHDGDLYLVTGPGTQKARNLAANPACTASVRLETLDLVLECEAQRVTDAETLETLAARYRDGGWPAEVEGDGFTAPYSAPSAGPPPWHLYRLAVRVAYGVATAEPHGATRWRFAV